MEDVLGFPKVVISGNEADPPITVDAFAEEHPQGRYVVAVSGHWTACINGIVYDTWDCGNEAVLSYYEITRFEKTPVEKKYCFTVNREQDSLVFVTVYDGNGVFATRQISCELAQDYIDILRRHGFFDFDEMGEYGFFMRRSRPVILQALQRAV